MTRINLYIQLVFILTQCIGSAQVAHYNQFPVMMPVYMLDDLQSDISFAYSLRLIVSEYEGPLIRLRRSLDDSEQDFGFTENDLVDIEAIDTWRTGNTVFVVTWYDQSVQNIDAIQPIKNSQMQLITDPTHPYLVGDGSNDLLIVPQSIQLLTEAGKNGSVFAILYATDRSQSTFGTLSGKDRWLSHVNWSNEQCYFDPGYCCNGPRSFINQLPTHPTAPGSLNVWDQYTFVRRDDPAVPATDRTIARLGGVGKFEGGFPDEQSCGIGLNFGIGAAISNEGNIPAGASTTRFLEFIMYKVGLEDEQINIIEADQISFWNL